MTTRSIWHRFFISNFPPNFQLSRYQNKELALVRSSAAPKDNVADLMEMMLKKKE